MFYKRNLTCLTFLINKTSMPMKKLLAQTTLPNNYIYTCTKEIDDINILINEFMAGYGVEEGCLVSVKDNEKSVELWSTCEGFKIKFYKKNEEGLFAEVKMVRVDNFIREFTSEQEFFVYLTDFIETFNEWLNEGESIKQYAEPELENVNVAELLAERVVNAEDKIKTLKEEVEKLTNSNNEIRESIKLLISLVERLNNKKH